MNKNRFPEKSLICIQGRNQDFIQGDSTNFENEILWVPLTMARFRALVRNRIRMDPQKDMPPGSGSAWTDADQDPGGEKAYKMFRFIR